MPIVSMEQVRADLAPHLDDVRMLALNAWASYHEDIPERTKRIFCARSRASGVHDYIVDYANQFVARTPAARPFKRKQMCGIVIGNRYAIRFKKLDEENRSSNQPSRQVRQFREQMSLDGIDAILSLELGYVLDALQREILDVRLVCPSGEGIAWAMSLTPGETKAIVIDIFDGADEDHEVDPAEIVPKKSAEIIRIERKGNEDQR